MIGISPSRTWDHSHACQMCELVSRMAMVGSLCLPVGGLQASVTAVFTPAVPDLLISVLNLPCSSVTPSIPVVLGVNIGRGLLLKGQLLLWCSFISLLQVKNLSLFTLSLGSCYVDISLLLSFSFIFLYSQEMYPPFQVYSWNKRIPLAFSLCTLYLLTLTDYFFSISTKPACKTRGARGEWTSIQLCWGGKLYPSISPRRKTNKMAMLWGAHNQNYATRKFVDLLSLCGWLNGCLKTFSITHAIEGTE